MFKIAVFSIALFLASPCLAETTPILSKKLIEGVYYMAGKDSRMIIELKRKGFQFRYWFASDMGSSSRPKNPLTGDYVFKEGIVYLQHPFIYQKEWHLFLLNGKPSLWRPNAVEDWQASKELDIYGILYLQKHGDPQKLWDSSWH